VHATTRPAGDKVTLVGTDHSMATGAWQLTDFWHSAWDNRRQPDSCVKECAIPCAANPNRRMVLR
jgi:hypothetical protein